MSYVATCWLMLVGGVAVSYLFGYFFGSGPPMAETPMKVEPLQPQTDHASYYDAITGGDGR